MSEMKQQPEAVAPKTWEVIVPIAGHASVVVEAETEEEAIDRAIACIDINDINEWTPLEQFNSGNVCYCPEPWDAEATEITES